MSRHRIHIHGHRSHRRLSVFGVTLAIIVGFFAARAVRDSQVVHAPQVVVGQDKTCAAGACVWELTVRTGDSSRRVTVTEPVYKRCTEGDRYPQCAK